MPPKRSNLSSFSTKLNRFRAKLTGKKAVMQDDPAETRQIKDKPRPNGIDAKMDRLLSSRGLKPPE